jgi:hypothetical protein
VVAIASSNIIPDGGVNAEVYRLLLFGSSITMHLLLSHHAGREAGFWLLATYKRAVWYLTHLAIGQGLGGFQNGNDRYF